MPDDPQRVALMCGPLLLAASVPEDTQEPMLVCDDLLPLKHLERTGVQEFAYRQYRFRPVGTFVEEPHAVYFDVVTEAEHATREERLRAERLVAADRAARTVDELRVGEMQPERDHDLRSDRSEVGSHQGRKWRHAQPGGWIEWTMRVDPATPNSLGLTWWSGDGGRELNLAVGGQTILERVTVAAEKPGFVEEFVDLPPSLTQGKESVQVRIEAGATVSPGLYGCRTLRSTPS